MRVSHYERRMMPQNEVVRLSAVVSGRLLEIPDYQRPYSWDSKQLSDLWEDLDLLGKSGTHYAGTLVLRRCLDAAGQPEQSMDRAGEVLEHYEVVDGQQRLTTCLILLDRLRRQFDVLATAGDPDAAEIASGLRSRYGVVNVSGVFVPRLALGAELNTYWKDHVLGDETYVGLGCWPENAGSGMRQHFSIRRSAACELTVPPRSSFNGY